MEIKLVPNCLIIVISVLCIAANSSSLSYNDHFPSQRRFPQDFPEVFGLLRLRIPYETYEREEVSHRYQRDFRNQGRSVLIRRSMPVVLCSEQYDRYDPKTGSCHTIGTRGPCGPYMIFTGNDYLDPNDRMYGHCECDYDRYDQPLVSLGGQCHFLYTQAMCLPGYWLTLSKNLGPICKANPCITKTRRSSGSPFVLYEGECVKLHMKSGLCPQKDNVIIFPKGSTEPTCGRIKGDGRRVYKRQISNTASLPCKKGMIRSSITGRCQKFFRQSTMRSYEV